MVNPVCACAGHWELPAASKPPPHRQPSVLTVILGRRVGVEELQGWAGPCRGRGGTKATLPAFKGFQCRLETCLE